MLQNRINTEILGSNALLAYVSFERQASADFMKYALKQSLLQLLCNRRKVCHSTPAHQFAINIDLLALACAQDLKFRGMYNISVTEAPKPSTIFWENLAHRSVNRTLREVRVRNCSHT